MHGCGIGVPKDLFKTPPKGKIEILRRNGRSPVIHASFRKDIPGCLRNDALSGAIQIVRRRSELSSPGLALGASSLHTREGLSLARRSSSSALPLALCIHTHHHYPPHTPHSNQQQHQADKHISLAISVSPFSCTLCLLSSSGTRLHA